MHQTCNCPRCAAVGRKIGAMNYEETQNWDVNGSYRESGIIFGKTGSYSENGQAQTRRASRFDEPEPYIVDSSAKIIHYVIVIIVMASLPMVMSFLISESQIPMPGLVNFLDNYGSIISAVVAAIYLFAMLKTTQEDAKLENQLNTEVWPKQLKRYNELYYCYKCHSIYDANGQVNDANPIGFQEMMNT